MDEYEFGEEPNWQGHEPADSEHDSQRNAAQLLLNAEIRGTRYEVAFPFAHNPSQKYIAGCIYECRESGRYWKIEGKEGKFKDAAAALAFLAETVEMERQKMMNDAFKESGI